VLFDVELERLLFYQDNFKELSQIPGQEIDLTQLSNPAYIIEGYISNIVNAFENRSKYTNVKFSKEDIDAIRSILMGYEFSRFITRDTIKRNLAGSFRNSILKTHQVNVNLPTLFRKYETAKNRADYLKAMLYRVDQPPKFSFILEDPWEMLDFYEAQLPEKEKEKRITALIDQYSPIKSQLEEGNLPMRLYRAIREADLFLSVYGPKLHKNFEQGIEPDYKLKQILYVNTIMNHDEIAINTCKSLPDKDPLKALLPFLEKMADIRGVDYSVDVK